MRCPNCQTLNPPNAKFCMECGNRLIVCPNCQTLNLPRARFCIECGTSLAELTRSTSGNGEPSIPGSRPIATPRALTGPLARPAATRLSEPQERRVVTVMFADITGSTPLADRLDPEDMRAILAGYFNLMAEQIKHHGGTVEKYIGDAVMAVFGAPVAHEDDPDRAIRAALDMQAALNHFNAARLARDSENTRLQMRIGINTGEVAAPGANAQRQDFLITGDAVNVAARLQQIAMPDTILVGERTYLATREVFDFRSLAPVQLKGKPLPLNAWAVQGLRSHNLSILQHPRGIDGLQAPLVGRALELTLVHATYARVRDARHSHLITLLGAPGIGKSRLIREFIEREEMAARCTTCDDDVPVEPRVLQGHCPPYGEGITYWPLVEILRSLIEVRDGESGEALELRFVEFVQHTLRKAKRAEEIDLVTNVLLQSIGRGLRGDPHAQNRRDIPRSTHNKDMDKGGPQALLQRACRVLLEAIAQSQPLILVIDDLQWADEALLTLLEYLTGRISDFPILFICLARPDFLERRREWGGGQPNFTTIILDALTSDETTELISELLSTDDLPDVLLHTIQRRAEGNPFFVEEIVRMLIDQGVLVKKEDGNTWCIGSQSENALSELASPATPPEDTLIDQHYILPLPRLPDTIQGVLAARVDLLSQIEKQVLQCASIVGRTFWLSAVLELVEDLDRAVVLQTLEQLIRRDFIEESEKARGPVEEEESFSFKHILIRDVVYNNIPRHRRSHKHAQLALWLEERSADRQETFADLLAYHYQQALANWSVTLHIHTVLDENSELSREEAGSPSRLLVLTRAELTERTIRYLMLAGDKAYRSYYTIRAIQAYTEAIELQPEDEADPRVLARMYQKLGHAYSQRSTMDDAWCAYRNALRLIQNQPEIARKELLCTYMHLAELATRWAGWFTNEPNREEVRSYIDEGLALLEGQPPNGDLASFLTYLSLWYVLQVRPTEPDQRIELAENALQHALEGLHVAEEAHDIISTWLALDALGFIYHKQHRYKEAHTTQHRRESLQSLIKSREERYDLYASLGSAHTSIGSYHAAAQWFGRAWEIAQTMESPSLLLSSMNGRLRIWHLWNRFDEAREVANHILQVSEQYQQDRGWQLRALEVLAEIAYREGKTQESEKLLQRHQRVFEQNHPESVHASGNQGLPENSESCTRPAMLLPGIHTARGEWRQALADIREIVRRTEPFPSPEALALLAELSVLANEPVEEQTALCARAIIVAEQSGARKFLAVALRARGRMQCGRQHWQEAERDLRQALAGFKDLDLPWEEGETLVCLGQFHRQQAALSTEQAAREKHCGLARFFLNQALGFFESLHMVHDIRKVREMLEAVPVAV